MPELFLNQETHRKPLQEFSKEELYEVLPIIWQKIIDRQIQDNPKFWKKFIEYFPNEAVAKAYALSRVRAVRVCFPAELGTVLNQLELSDKDEQTLASMFKEPGTASNLRLNFLKGNKKKHVNLIYIGNKSSNILTLIHELTHASESELYLVDNHAKKLRKEANKVGKKLDLSMKLAETFAGLGIIGLALPIALTQQLTEAATYSLLQATYISCFGVLAASLNYLFAGYKYNHFPQEKKANTYAREIAAELRIIPKKST